MKYATSYRYRLDRDLGRLDLIDVPLCWVMLNPSTADAIVDDPTIRRVKAFTAAAGYRHLIVVNRYAYRATKPIDLFDAEHPTGVANALAVRAAMTESARVVFAWGAFTGFGRTKTPPTNVERIAAECGHHPLCLGTTKAGAPRHPLYVPNSHPFVAFKSSPSGEETHLAVGATADGAVADGGLPQVDVLPRVPGATPTEEGT